MCGQPAEYDWPVIDAVAPVAEELGVTSAEVALAWIVGRPGIGSTLIGARTMEQLHANLAGQEPQNDQTEADEDLIRGHR